MSMSKIMAVIVLISLAAITIFHIIHYFLFCRYASVPGKSHCAVCGHHRVCQKYHHRK